MTVNAIEKCDNGRWSLVLEYGSDRTAMQAMSDHIRAGGERALEEAAKPWADFHGDLPDYDHPLRCVFESGVQYAVELLAKDLGVESYEVCDGTEEFDGDLGGTMLNILHAAGCADGGGDYIHTRDLRCRLTELDAALKKISAIRDSIVGMQGFNFSEHAYPMVAALDAAGYPGAGYKISRRNLGTLIDQIKAEEAKVEALAKAVKAILPIGDASKPDSAVFPIYVRMAELRGLHELAAISAVQG